MLGCGANVHGHHRADTVRGVAALLAPASAPSGRWCRPRAPRRSPSPRALDRSTSARQAMPDDGEPTGRPIGTLSEVCGAPMISSRTSSSARPASARTHRADAAPREAHPGPRASLRARPGRSTAARLSNASASAACPGLGRWSPEDGMSADAGSEVEQHRQHVDRPDAVHQGSGVSSGAPSDLARGRRQGHLPQRTGAVERCREDSADHSHSCGVAAGCGQRSWPT